jgi:CheY-like chemotaxis protein/MinD-like ATPase involved in chromosome partitioning or flagellar assembly
MAEKILIVDDDIDSLKLIGLMLQRHGYEVIAANAGNQAITKAFKENPDLIILDVMMPDMNGYEVCRRLRNNEQTRNTPIIMFTAKTLIDDKVAGFEAGADDYLTKPTHPTELASRVKAMLQRRGDQGSSGSSDGMTIGLIGAKGGLGTTTITVSMGAALLQMNRDPVIADFRPGQGSMSLYLGLDDSARMADILSRPASEINNEMVRRGIVSHKSGLRALMSSTRPKENLMNFSLDSVKAVVQELRAIGQPALFDLGAGINAITSNIYTLMNQIILVVDPSDITLSMARDLLSILKQSDNLTIHLVVVNRVQINQQPPWHEVERLLNHEIRAIISAAPDLAYQAAEDGVPLFAYQPNAIVSSQIGKLAEDVAIEA